MIHSAFFDHEDRYEPLIEWCREKRIDVLKILAGGATSVLNHRNLPTVVYGAVKHGRLDTLQRLHREYPQLLRSIHSRLVYERRYGEYPKRSDVPLLTFLLEQDFLEPGASDLVSCALAMEDADAELELFEKQIERVKIEPGCYFHSLPWRVISQVSVASYKRTMKILDLLEVPRYTASDIKRELIFYAYVKSRNFTLLRYLLEEESPKVTLEDWPRKFFTRRKKIHRRDVRYFKLLIQTNRAEWEKFVADRDSLPHSRYKVKPRKTIIDLYDFVYNQCGEQDEELYRAYRREIGRPCICCEGKCDNRYPSEH